MELERHRSLHCANCGQEIAWEPVQASGQAFCCGGCAHGGPCYCSYDPPEGDSLSPVRHTDDLSPRRGEGSTARGARCLGFSPDNSVADPALLP